MPDIPDIHTELQNILRAVYGEEVRGSIVDALFKMRNVMDDWNNTAMTSKYQLSSADDLNTFYSAGTWWYTDTSIGMPQHWPFDVNTYGRFIVFGESSTATETCIQIAFSDNTICKIVYRYRSNSGWSDWTEVLTQNNSFSDHGTLSDTDDLNDEKFWHLGLWALTATNNMPSNWPTEASNEVGRLICFGALNPSSNSGKVQMIITTKGNVFTRIGRMSTATYTEWTKLASYNGDTIAFKGQLDASDDIDTFFSSGMWTAYSSNIPLHWPDEASNGGRLVVFGAEGSVEPTGKAQIIFTRGSNEILYRTGTSVSWNSWATITDIKSNKNIIMHRRQLTSEDDIDSSEFYQSGVWTRLSSVSPINWPVYIGSGKLIVLGADSNNLQYKVQFILSFENQEILWRFGRSNGWSDWVALDDFEANKNLVIQRRQLSLIDDIDSSEFYQSGVWTCLPSSKPINWPENVGGGKLIVFGADSDNRVLKAQIIMTLNTDEIWWRMGRTDGWSTWIKITKDDDVLSYKGVLSATDNIDEESFWVPGTWVCSSVENIPHGWPNEVGATTGRLVCFGNADASSSVRKFQIVTTAKYGFTYFRIGRSSGFSPWHQIGSHGTGRESTYVAIGASTTEGLPGGGQSPTKMPYPWYVAKMGGFTEFKNLAIGGTGLINRSSIQPYIIANNVITSEVKEAYAIPDNKIQKTYYVQGVKHYTITASVIDEYHVPSSAIQQNVVTDSEKIRYNFMDVATDPANRSVLEKADLITINYSNNDRSMQDSNGHSITSLISYHEYSAAYDKMIGTADDYFPYDRASLYSSDPVERSRTSIAMHENCMNGTPGYTVAGAWNYLLRYLAMTYPTAQLVLCKSVKYWRGHTDVSLNEKTHKIQYVTRDSTYYYRYTAFENNLADIMHGLVIDYSEAIGMIRRYVNNPEGFDAAAEISSHAGATITVEDLIARLSVCGDESYSYYLDLFYQALLIKPITDRLGVRVQDVLRVIGYYVSNPSSEYAKKLEPASVADYINQYPNVDHATDGAEDTIDNDNVSDSSIDTDISNDDDIEELDPDTDDDEIIISVPTLEPGYYDLNNPVFLNTETWIWDGTSAKPDNYPDTFGPGKVVIFGLTASSKKGFVIQTVFEKATGYVAARAYRRSTKQFVTEWKRIGGDLQVIKNNLTFINPTLPNLAKTIDEIRSSTKSLYSRFLWIEKTNAVVEEIADKLNIPIADPSKSFSTPWTYYREKFHSSTHPSKDAYRNYNRAIAAAVLSKFAN